jgi:hypothetical protein
MFRIWSEKTPACYSQKHRHGHGQEAPFREAIADVSVLQASTFAENYDQGISGADRKRPTE